MLYNQQGIVFQSKGVSGEECQATLGTSVVLANLGDVLERIEVGLGAAPGRPEGTAEAFGGPNDATGSEIGRDSGSFAVQGSSSVADEKGSADGTVWLLLLEGGVKAVATGVTVQTERAGAIGPTSQPRQTKIGGVARLRRNGRTTASIAGVKTKLTPCAGRALAGIYVWTCFPKFTAVAKASKR